MPVLIAVRWEALRSELAFIVLSLKVAQPLIEMFLRSLSGLPASSVFRDFDGSFAPPSSSS